MEVGDLVLADKGFPQIVADANNVGAFVVMPPFKSSIVKQFSDAQNNECYKVASVRVHVERAIRRLKYFKIFRFVQNQFIPHMSKLAVILSFFY